MGIDHPDPAARRRGQRSARLGESAAELTSLCPLKTRLRTPITGFDALVIGEPRRVVYHNQYGLIYPLFVCARSGLRGPTEPFSCAQQSRG